MKKYFIVLIFHTLLYHVQAQDRPCSPRHYGQSSLVCVCNSTYCDDISNEGPLSEGNVVCYTSTMSGRRFSKTSGTLGPFNQTHDAKYWFTEAMNAFLNFHVTLEVKRDYQFQTIEGFGGALTDASAINILQLSPATQNNLINSYFSPTGLEYNMIRIAIGGTDFSEYPYAYNMWPADDKQLTNFSLSLEDNLFKIPLIQRVSLVSSNKILVSAAIWSPPLWMKTGDTWGGISTLKPEYYQTYADYHYKFVDEYKKAGVDIWSISTGNEPTTGIVPIIPINSLGWLPLNQAKWIAENLGPTFKKSPYSDVKILALDEQRFTLPLWLDMMASVKDAIKYIDGIAVHWYLNAVIPPSVLDTTHSRYPKMFLISTEGSTGSIPLTASVSLGAWERGEKYMKYIIEDLNHWVSGWIDWNMVLNRLGGPSWINHHVDSPVIVLPESDEFLKQPTFYAMGHFSKFIPRGSKRVHVNNVKGSIENAAFLRPDGGIVVVFYNSNLYDKTVILREKGKGAFKIAVPPRSFQTVLYW